MKKKFVILDGSSLLYRAFYAVPLLTAPTGEYTNAVYGFANMLTKLLQEIKPDKLVIAFDKGKKTFRNEMYAEYKGTRKPTPAELLSQIPLLHTMAEAWGISLVELAGYEADDIIGTLSTKAAARGYDAYVVTGDRDALQLVRPNLRVLLTKKGITELADYDEAKFQEEYGFPPLKLIDLKGLMGDASDNIPGIPGVGQKTAAKLLLAYGSVEEVLAHADEVSGKKLQEKIKTNSEQAVLSKKLATIDCQAPVDFAEEEYSLTPDIKKLQAFCQRYGLKTVLKNIEKIYQNVAASDSQGSLFAEPPEAVIPAYTVVETAMQAAAFLQEAKNSDRLAFTCIYHGNTDRKKILGIAFAYGEKNVYVPSVSPAYRVAKSIFAEEIAKVTFDVKQFYHVEENLAGSIFDVEMAAYLLHSGAGCALSEITAQYLDGQNIAKGKNPIEQCVADNAVLLPLAEVLSQKIRQENLESLYEEIELPLIKVLASMEKTGVYLDKEKLQEEKAVVAAKLADLEKLIYEQAGCEFNLNSPKQLSEVLFEKLQLPAGKKTKSGYSTNAEVLEKLRGEHPVINNILSYRMWNKLKSTYLDSMETLISPYTARIHTSFNQMVTTTGRLSSSDPNLQNIPVRTEEGKKIRMLFVPGDGYSCLIAADYSQIELRLLAHMSEDEHLIAAFKSGEDIHARTAAEVFGVELGDVTPEMRRHAKAVNFGIVYGISDYGLAKDINVSRKQAAEYIAKYFERYAGVKAYLDKLIADARKNGFVTTMFNRRRDLPAISSSNFNQRSLAERMAMNTPIQGTAADVIKLAMIAVDKKLREKNLQSRMLLQVHDELVIEAAAGEEETVKEILRSEMENVVKLSVPLTVDISEGKNWAEAK